MENATTTIRKGKGITMKKFIITCMCAVALGIAVIGGIFFNNREEEPGKQGRVRKAKEQISDVVGEDSPDSTTRTVPLSEAEIGSYVLFGSYEQDNNVLNGLEDIEWLVLDRDGDRILVISRYVLDWMQFVTEYRSVTWEDSTLRKWLNETFLNEAFSTDEQVMIPTVMVSVDKNPAYNTPTGNDTKDQVFLLSYSEVEKYFSDRDARKVPGTEYCSSKCTYIPDNGCLRWWLRTPGENHYRFCEVDSEGLLEESGPHSHRNQLGVRPAMWISIGE